MKIERLGSPTEFARTVSQLGLPIETAHLHALIEATFYASLHEEEARHTEFSVVWEPVPRGCRSIVPIAQPVAVTPKNLAKLAPATRSEATAIAVRPDGDRLVVWALIELDPLMNEPVTIRVLGSGVLRVDHQNVPCALYARGETYVMTGVKSPVALLARTVAGLSESSALAICLVATRAFEHGHGGMLLLVPASTAMPVGVRVHYALDTGAEVLVRNADASDLVARLTAIDNAVLLDTDLRLRGFGVQVIEGDAPDISFTHTDPYSDDVHVDDLSTFKGTRHPAGVIFCMRQAHAAAAIIVSQDARISLAVRNAQGGVEVLGTYERGFGWP